MSQVQGATPQLFHGTVGDHAILEPGPDGGIYFTDAFDDATEFAAMKACGQAGNQCVITASLFISRPLVVDYEGVEVTDRIKKRIARDIARAKRENHDALIIQNVDNFGMTLTTTYIVFNSSQVSIIERISL